MNAEIGKKMAVILLASEEAPEAMYTAMHTSQLHRRPRMKACKNYIKTKRVDSIITYYTNKEQGLTVSDVLETAVAAAAGPTKVAP